MPRKKPAADARLDIRLPKEDLKAFAEAAERDGHVSLTAWVIYSLRKAEKESRSK